VAMSWDVSIFGGKEPPPVHNWPPGWQPEVIGSGEEVRQRISAYLPEVHWQDPTRGAYLGDGFSFEIDIGDSDPVRDICVHVRGGGDPVADLRRFVVPNGWYMADWSTGDLIDPNEPPPASWARWQAFSDKIRNEPSGS